MRHLGSVFTLLLALAAAPPAFSQAPAAAPAAPAMTMTTTGFPDGGQIPLRFSQAQPGAAPGEGTSPPLAWANAPAGTKSFVLHMHDLEAARNKTTEDQLHWLVWNIPETAKGLPEGVAKGSKLADGSRQISATGPFHHYVFEVFALDTMLPVEPTDDPFATRVNVLAAIQGHVLGKAVYMGLFRRPN